jgi:two-component system, cell cycle sensor histidine kinase and response regulator CckA
MSFPSTPARHQRILVIDDNSAIHDDFRKILGPPTASDAELQAAEARLFGAPQAGWFEIDSAAQGEEGLQKVERSLQEDRPYAVAFVDMRMPPGWDGIETTKRIWEMCPDLQIVICTAYAECCWDEVLEEIKAGDRLLILKKPFDTIEVLQLANSLTEKWRLLQESRSRMNDLDVLVKQRTEDLESSRLAAMDMMEDAVRNREREREVFEELKREMSQRGKLEEKFREKASLLDMARDAIVVRDLDHQITYWNKSAERLYGWSAAEMMGRPMTDLEQKGGREFAQACEQLMQTGEWIGELHQIGKDGRELIVEGRWTLVRDEAGQPKSILAINTNITEQKKLEQQFFRSQRMESIGAVAGGIAHDLNNVLTPITMAIELLRLQVTDAKSQQVLDTMESSAKRGADMISQVLSFARGMEGKRIEVQPRHLITDIEKICGETFPKSIQVRAVMAPGLWAVEGDPTQLHQVLFNLCVNARDAMPHGGKIFIRAKNLTLDAQFASMDMQVVPGPYVVIEVEDTGMGIPKNVIDKIFDPFFTTKEVGKGTGLGLSTSLSIVKSHGGFVQVESEPGAGARFTVHLPARAEVLAEPPKEPCLDLPKGNGELVLIVDDEAFVRQITRQTLEAFGYRTMLAAEGAEALSLYIQHKDEIALVLTDMMMPVMDGASTIAVLSRINPAVRVIASSGLSDEHAEKALRAGARRFIPKPFSGDTLLGVLRDVLEERS